MTSSTHGDSNNLTNVWDKSLQRLLILHVYLILSRQSLSLASELNVALLVLSQGFDDTNDTFRNKSGTYMEKAFPWCSSQRCIMVI